MAEIRCPMCAHVNPEGSLHCESCDARLVPMGDIGKALDLPMDSQPDDDDLSAFLDKIVDEGGQDTIPADSLDEEVLAWLDDEHIDQVDDVLRESPVSDEDGEEPDFRSLVEEEIDEKVITNWLSKPPSEEGGTEENADWMTLVVSEPDEDLSGVESWFDQTDEESYQDEADRRESANEEIFTAPLPEWLSEQSYEEIAAEETETAGFTAQLPNWMDAVGDEEIEPDEVEEEAAEEEPVKAEEPQFTAQLPDWMTEVDETPEAVSSAELLPEDALPDWFTQELDVETLEQLEPPSTESVQDEGGSKPLSIPKVSTGNLPWMGRTPLGEESEDTEGSQEEFELPTGTVEPGPVEKLPRIQTGALPWLNLEEEEDWVASDESEEESEVESEDIFTQEVEAAEPDVEEVLADEQFTQASVSFPAEDEFATPLDELVIEDEALTDESFYSEDEESESVSFDDVMADDVSFFAENQSLKTDEEPAMEDGIDMGTAAEVSKSWTNFLESADKLGSEEELPEWFAKTGNGKPVQPAEMADEKAVAAEEPVDALPVEPEPEEVEEPEPPTKKHGTTWSLLFGRRKQKKEKQTEESGELTPEPAIQPEPEPEVVEDGGASELTQESEWDLSTILSDSQPLTTESDEEQIAEEFKADLVDSTWLVDESGKPLVGEIDNIPEDVGYEEIETEPAPGLVLPQQPEQKPAGVPAEGMSSLDRLTAALGLGDEEDTEGRADEDLIGFAGTTELPAWMMGDDDQEAEATAMLDAALGETKLKPDAMTAGLPDWLEEAAEEMEAEAEAEAEAEDIRLPEPEEELDFDESDQADEDEVVITTAELPSWLTDDEAEVSAVSISSVSDELDDSQYTDWLAEFAVDEEPEETVGEIDEPLVEKEGTAVLPDWLLASDQEPEPSDESLDDLFQTTPLKPGVTTGLPDWLSTYADEKEEELPASEPIEIIQEPAEVDDWLITSDDEEEQPLVVSDTNELNEWVQEHGIQFPAMDEDAEPLDDEVIPVDVSKDLPDWVFELEPETEGAPIRELNGRGTAELPAWLVAGDESPPVDESQFEEPLMEEQEFFDFLAPDDSNAATALFTTDEFDEDYAEEDDDLRSLIISESTYAPTVELDSQAEWLSSYAEEETTPDDSFDDEELHEVEEIPDWVQLADTSGEWQEGVESFGEALKFDTFEEETIREIPNEERNIQLMERILLSEKKAVPVPRIRQRNRQLTLRLTITVLMIALVVVGLYYLDRPVPNFIANAPIQVVQFHQQMQYHQQTAPDKPVLVVFDLQPAYEGELSVYSELPLKALMENNARIFTFSTVPEGAALANKMMVDVVMENNLVYNTQSQALNLGYLPGGASAIRDFALNMRFTVHGLDVGVNGVYIWEHPSTSDINSLDDFAMVIVMTDDLDKARLWIEQSSLYLPASTPLLMVSSAKVTPLLKPYLLSGQLGGLIGNPIDAASYATLSNESSKVIYFWKAYEMGIYLMMASVFGGAVYLIVNQSRKDKSGNARGGRG